VDRDRKARDRAFTTAIAFTNDSDADHDDDRNFVVSDAWINYQWRFATTSDHHIQYDGIVRVLRFHRDHTDACHVSSALP